MAVKSVKRSGRARRRVKSLTRTPGTRKARRSPISRGGKRVAKRAGRRTRSLISAE